MAITHGISIRNAVADLVLDAIDAGAAAGSFVLLTSSDAVVAELTFSDPAFVSAAGGAASANSIIPDTNAVGGVVAKFAVVDSNDNVVFEGTVSATGGGGDIEMTSTTVAAGETVSCSAFTYTAMD